MKFLTSKSRKFFTSMFGNKVNIEREDRTFLLIGTYGSDIDLFADVIMDDPNHRTPLDRKDTSIRVIRRTIPGINGTVALVVAPGIDTGDREDRVIKQVRKQLKKRQACLLPHRNRRRDDPYVDHILVFPQDPLQVRPKPAENRGQLLASLCRETGDSTVGTKVIPILKDEAIEGRSLQICESWSPYMGNAIGNQVFRGTKDSACAILQTVIEGGRA
ncbi:hypothetical protein P691DRAFT_764241 [Macrolepiota fuliginosa MF-IS2]|uniref:Uncharacterized protein n=1 Tax=Macrolepiota fuliginosa MF-IS2 TaxID=1400762 RepID=A0A9P5X4H1_9AGAR|nr:hypothetical protein P691DRAFT_764241 [Macrolepiota fuliginosa MF-IS2]